VNATSARTGAYPAWQYEADSKIRDCASASTGTSPASDPQIRAIHAGLEMRPAQGKLPQTDMISFGPNLYSVHTPEEHLSISSVATTWAFPGHPVLARSK